MSLTTAADDLTGPADPLEAVTHPNPYPYYARLAAERPLHWDARLGAWVAASAEAVEAVLTNPACRVRPPGEPVPTALVGSAAAEIFGRLVRMNDGNLHARLKQAVGEVLERVDPADLARSADARAAALVARLAPQRDPAALTRFCFALPVEVMASLLGLPEDTLPQLPSLVDRYVLAASGLADGREISEGAAAARTLLDLAGEALDSGVRPSMLADLTGAAQAAGSGERAFVLANGVGLMIQAFEATAALIGGAALALGRHPSVLAMVSERPDLLPQAIAETIRWDPSTQIMRRFVCTDAVVGGVPMRAGEPVLVLAAAAARDPAANPEPDRFDIFRRDRVLFGFGRGAHACPAQAIAPAIAAAGLGRLLAAGLDPTGLEAVRSYRRSPFRIPLFGDIGHDHGR